MSVQQGGNLPDELAKLIQGAVKDIAEEDGWANLSQLGQRLVALQPDFDTRTYGRAKLSGLLELLDDLLIEKRGLQKYVALRQPGP